MKRREGQSIEDLALQGLLYAEACEKLNKGELYYKRRNKLIGQQTTAMKINNWVQQQFLVRSDQFDLLDLSTSIENEALYGMLYKEAVQLLKQGNFKVLGAQDTALTIQKWVNKEYLKRTIRKVK